MLDELQILVDGARHLVGALDADSLSGPEARVAVESFVELEKLAASGKMIAAGRLDQTDAWVGDGSSRDFEAWMASTCGTSVGAARATVGTARRLGALPATAAAMRAGNLSPVQAEAICAAAKADPRAERSLLDLAKTSGVKGLKTECDRVRAAACRNENERYERAHQNRTLRHRTLADGSGAIDIRGPLDRTAQIMAALQPLEKQLFEQNRAAKRIEHPDAVAFDALVTLCDRFTRGQAADAGPGNASTGATTRTRGTRPLATIVVHVSHAAYERGYTTRGEICEIEGIGPIPVAVARRLASDSIMKAVVIDGVDVTRVSHLGRTIPAHLRTAIETRDRACVIAGCDVDRHLEIDHNIPVAARGPTELANLGRVCHHHHRVKTIRDLRRVGPLGGQHLVTIAEYEQALEAERGPPQQRAA